MNYDGLSSVWTVASDDLLAIGDTIYANFEAALPVAVSIAALFIGMSVVRRVIFIWF